jgi:hypothetical protein
MEHLRQLAASLTTMILSHGRPCLLWEAVFLVLAVIISPNKAG